MASGRAKRKRDDVVSIVSNYGVFFDGQIEDIDALQHLTATLQTIVQKSKQNAMSMGLRQFPVYVFVSDTFSEEDVSFYKTKLAQHVVCDKESLRVQRISASSS
jgi:hypothetical protein